MKRILIMAGALLLSIAGKAIVKPAPLIGDGMVLQQQTDVRLWGKAKADSRVTITCSWSKDKVTAQTGADGRWSATLATPTATMEPQTVTLSDGTPLTLHDVLIGEVWFASGQSNMEMPMEGFFHCPVEGYNEGILKSTHYTDRLHFVTIPRQGARYPVDTVEARWENCTPEAVSKFSAVGYYFAAKLIDVLQCPVGVINCSWGGTPVEGWMPEDIVTYYPDIYVDGNQYKFPEAQTVFAQYNGMFWPLKGYTVKGMLWYQGESNVWRCQSYAQHFKDMVTRWRSDWGQGDLPFYFVEIAPFSYGTPDHRAAQVREAQAQVLHELPNMGMVGTNDLLKPYEYNQIHPSMKREVGERLSYLALHRDYGYESVICDSPEFEKMEVRDGQAILSFSNVGRGWDHYGDLEGFEICGADQKFYKAQGHTNPFTLQVVLSAPEVKEPVAVRYCFKDYAVGNLKNVGGLPLLPFRTDK